MSKDTETETIGVDLGDQRSAVCVLDGDRVVVESRKTIRTTKRGFSAFFGKRGPARVVLETGTHSPWVSELLQSLGHEVIVANARRVQLISRSYRKTDQADAELLARLGRADKDLLSPVKHRGAIARRDLTLLRARDGLVRSRTALVNSVRGLVKSAGECLPRGCSTHVFPKRVRAAGLPTELVQMIEPVLGAIEDVTKRIVDCESAIKKVAKRYPESALLQQIKGVGPLLSLAFVLSIEDVTRFKSSRRVGSYFGLVPRQQASGKRAPELRITKAGDAFVRKLLVTAAQYILGPFGPDTALRRWGHKLAERGEKNAKKRAIVAVARKLAVLLHRLWVTGEVYEPLRGVDA
jgi:transposase